MTQAVEETIEVYVPLSTTYNQSTQFEEFPRFMNGVESVQQLDDRRLHWVAEIAGKREEWDAEITAQTPDEGVAWVATEGKGNNGVVRFDPVAEDRTRVTVRIDWEPEGLVEKAGAAMGMDDRQVSAEDGGFVRRRAGPGGPSTETRRGRPRERPFP